MATQPGIASHPGLWQEAELWRRRGEPDARAELVNRFVPFAKSVALRYKGRAESLDDLIQVANLGLMKAIDRFDPEKGHAFMAFASSTIHGELKRHFRDRVSTVRLPRGIYERIGDVESVTTDLRHDLGREPTAAEVAEMLNCPVEEILDSYEASQSRHPIPLQFEGDGEEGLLEEHIGKEDDRFELTEDRLAVSEAIGRLGPSDRSLIQMRFGEEMPQWEIGEKLGCSQMQVSRRLRRLMERLNAEVTDDTRVAA